MFKTFGGQTYYLGASIGSTDTTITLASFTVPITGAPVTMALMGTDIAYGTIAPKTTSSEFISFTGITQNADGTADLTGVVRGLQRYSPYASDANFELPHAGQSVFILSDAPTVFNSYGAKDNDETITGTWTFPNDSDTPLLGTSYVAPTIQNQVASKGYVDATTIAGAPNASTSVQGLVQIPTQAQVDAKTDIGSTTAYLSVIPSTQRSTLASDYVVDVGNANGYFISPTPAITSYQAGQTFSFKAAHANTTSSQINISSIGSKSILNSVGGSLVANDILANQIIFIEYDGTQFIYLNNTGNGVMDLATNQSAGGVKHFTGSLVDFTAVPRTSATPTLGIDLVNKNYTDNKFIYQFFSTTVTKNSNDASGSQNIAHGFVGAPKFTRITAIPDGGTSTAQAFTAYNGTTQSSTSIYGTTGNLLFSQSFVLNSEAAASGNTQIGVLSFTSTNINITWTKTGAPVGSYNLLVEAFG